MMLCVYYNSHMELLFTGSNGQQLNANRVVEEIRKFMNGDPNRCYKIIIGSDSEHLQDRTADFVTAIVVHRVGNGGRYFWRRVASATKYHTLRDRITNEVLLSLSIARELLEEVKRCSLPKFDFKIHVDVGENGATKAIIQELVGMIRANNFEVRTKPDSYAASKVADRHV